MDNDFRKFINTIEGIVWEANPDLSFTFVSPQAEKILGYPPGLWISDRDFWPNHLHPADRDRAVAFCTEQTGLLKPHAFEYRMIAADGGVVWLHDVVSVEVEGGRPTKLRGIMLDVTHEKEMEERLRQSERRCQQLIESAEEGIWLLNGDLNTTFVNPKMTQLLGYGAEEMIGRSGFDFIGEDHRTYANEIWARIRKGFRQQVEFLLFRKDGSKFWAMIAANPIYDAKCRFSGVLALVRDITESRSAEQALKESEQRFKQLAEGSLEGVAIHDGQRILLANAAMANIFGYSIEELQGKKLDDLAPSESRELVRSKIASHSKGPYEAQGLRKDGSVFWGELNGREIVYQGRPARVTSMRDITDRKRLEGERERTLAQERQARLEAERSTQLRDEFLAIASHELRTPLTPLKMYLQLLRHSLTELGLPDTSRSRMLWTALDRSDLEYDRLNRLINDLLDATRISAGRLVLNKDHCDLSTLVVETTSRFSREIERAGCLLNLNLAPGVSGSWDRTRLEQVLSNLLTNALKYGAGKPIHISLVAKGKIARLCVEDQGIGIAKDKQHSIFERFVRVAPVEHFGGLGLGLFIVQQIVTAHGGTVSVESEPGKGSRFLVELPI